MSQDWRELKRQWREQRREQKRAWREQWREQRRARRGEHAEWHYQGPSSVWTGTVLLAVGVILLLDRLGIVSAGDIFRFWPMLLFAGGLAMGLQPVSIAARASFGLLAAAGLLLQANNLGYVHLRGALFWPLVLIGVGVVLLVRAMEARTSPTRDEAADPVVASPAIGEAEDLGEHDSGFRPFASFHSAFRSGRIRGEAVFSGIQRRVDDQAFERASVSALFGGYELDLRPAGIKGEVAYVKAEAVFGGIEIVVPESWNVRIDAQGVFGGVSDETKHPDLNGSIPPKRLIVTGAAVFGGIVVKNSSSPAWH